MKIKHFAFLFNIFFLKKKLHSFTSLLKEYPIQNKKNLKSAFSNKRLKLITSDGHSYFSHSFPFLYGDSAGGYIKRFFLPIGKYSKQNP